MNTFEGPEGTQPRSTKRRRILTASASAVGVLIIGAVVLGLQVSRDATDIAEAAPAPVVQTTLPTPTLTAPTTAPPATAPPTTEARPTTAPPATSPPTTQPTAQTLDATLTWDGETCTFAGVEAARAGDTLSLSMINDSARWAFFQVLYLTSGSTVEDATDFFDNVMGNRLNENSPGPPLFLVRVQEADAIGPAGSLTVQVRLRQPREHLLICSAADSGNYGADREIYNAKESVVVTDQ